MNPAAAAFDQSAASGVSQNFSALIAMMITLLCIALGYITLLRWEVRKWRGEKSPYGWNDALAKVLDLLKKAKE